MSNNIIRVGYSPQQQQQQIQQKIEPQPKQTQKVLIKECDGEVSIAGSKVCLNELSALSIVGLVAAASFLIILWKKIK